MLDEYVDHYNQHRPHRSLNQHAPLTMTTTWRATDPELAQLRRNDTVFGLIHEYRLAA